MNHFFLKYSFTDKILFLYLAFYLHLHLFTSFFSYKLNFKYVLSYKYDVYSKRKSQDNIFKKHNKLNQIDIYI
jgi:hypothetical protein